MEKYIMAKEIKKIGLRYSSKKKKENEENRIMFTYLGWGEDWAIKKCFDEIEEGEIIEFNKGDVKHIINLKANMELETWSSNYCFNTKLEIEEILEILNSSYFKGKLGKIGYSHLSFENKDFSNDVSVLIDLLKDNYVMDLSKKPPRAIRFYDSCADVLGYDVNNGCLKKGDSGVTDHGAHRFVLTKETVEEYLDLINGDESNYIIYDKKTLLPLKKIKEEVIENNVEEKVVKKEQTTKKMKKMNM
jgi:hypothetical protein